jgi:2-polyprenyl-3-methyl-5-hydroxy-6-metoxy-1,4-benzoquinol methylase
MTTLPTLEKVTQALEEKNFPLVESLCQRVLEFNPEAYQYSIYLGIALLLNNQEEAAQNTWLSYLLTLEEAEYEESFQEIITGLENLADKYQDREDFSEAETIYNYLLKEELGGNSIPEKLGKNLFTQAKFSEAIVVYQGLDTNNPKIAFEIGKCLLNLEEYFQAFRYFYHATLQQPDNLDYLKFFVISLRTISFHSVNEQLSNTIKKCCEHPEVNHQHLLKPIVSILQLDPTFQSILEICPQQSYADFQAHINRETLKQVILDNPWLNFILRETVITDLSLERLILYLRRLLLQDSSLEAQNFLTSLAIQNYYNEYVCSSSSEEEEIVKELRSSLEISDNLNSLERELVILANYQRLSQLSRAEEILELSEKYFNPATQALIQKTLARDLAERALREEIQQLTPILDNTSVAVQSQYEENPYPRWLGITKLEPIPASQYIRFLFPSWQQSEFLKQSGLKVLVAGCGTGAEAIVFANNYKNVEILAIDLSLTSLAYAKRMTKQFAIKNITFMQADILKLDSLTERFQIITSTGVIHHLKNPEQGLKILVDLLVPNGLIKIALYSRLARQSIAIARQKIKDNNLLNNPASIRQFREEIITEVQTEAWMKDLTNFSDFYTLSSCRDLLFHVQEHTFTFLEVKGLLEKVGLKFIGLEISNKAIKSSYAKQFPEDITMTNLDNWHQFEEAYPTTFRAMYHIWCQKL